MAIFLAHRLSPFTLLIFDLVGSITASAFMIIFDTTGAISTLSHWINHHATYRDCTVGDNGRAWPVHRQCVSVWHSPD